MFSGKRTTTCSIGVVGFGRAAVVFDAAPDIEMPRMVAPATTAVAPNANSFLRIRNRGSLDCFHSLGGVTPQTRHAAGSSISPIPGLSRRSYQLVTIK